MILYHNVIDQESEGDVELGVPLNIGPEAGGYDIAGPTREIYLSDPRYVAPKDRLTRLEFPVCTPSNDLP